MRIIQTNPAPAPTDAAIDTIVRTGISRGPSVTVSVSLSGRGVKQARYAMS